MHTLPLVTFKVYMEHLNMFFLPERKNGGRPAAQRMKEKNNFGSLLVTYLHKKHLEYGKCFAPRQNGGILLTAARKKRKNTIFWLYPSFPSMNKLTPSQGKNCSLIDFFLMHGNNNNCRGF